MVDTTDGVSQHRRPQVQPVVPGMHIPSVLLSAAGELEALCEIVLCTVS